MEVIAPVSESKSKSTMGTSDLWLVKTSFSYGHRNSSLSLSMQWPFCGRCWGTYYTPVRAVYHVPMCGSSHPQSRMAAKHTFSHCPRYYSSQIGQTNHRGMRHQDNLTTVLDPDGGANILKVIERRAVPQVSAEKPKNTYESSPESKAGQNAERLRSCLKKSADKSPVSKSPDLSGKKKLM